MWKMMGEKGRVRGLWARVRMVRAIEDGLGKSS